MRPFDQAWQLLKRYVPHGHTSLPGADIAATILPQESDKDFREHARYLEYKNNPAMQGRLKEHFKGNEMVENPRKTRIMYFDGMRAPTGDMGRPLNFGTQQAMGTEDDSAFTYNE